MMRGACGFEEMWAASYYLHGTEKLPEDLEGRVERSKTKNVLFLCVIHLGLI